MNKYDALKIENQLCFPLYSASREVVKRYYPYLSKIGLTYTQYITMMIMWEYERIGVKALGERLYLDSGTVTPVVKGLEKKGLVVRERSQSDERQVIVAITKEGMELREKAVEIPKKMASCLDIDENEAKMLYSILYKMLKSNK